MDCRIAIDIASLLVVCSALIAEGSFCSSVILNNDAILAQFVDDCADVEL